MKYPAKQFDLLKRVLNIFAEDFEVKLIDESSLHYMAFQQFSEGQTHNWFYVNSNGILKRGHQITDFTDWRKLVDINEPFELYPDGCNDTHIETAVKRALKEI